MWDKVFGRVEWKKEGWNGRSRFRLSLEDMLDFSYVPEEGQEEEPEYYVYYVNKEKTKTVAVGYEPQAEDAKGMVEELIGQLFQGTDSPDIRKAAPKEVELMSWKLENAQLYLYFNAAYGEMDNVSEVLCRAAFVRTLTQVEGVGCISFYVGDTPLVDANGTLIGLMTAESFIENPGEQINTIQTASITLYFANKKGTKLVQEVQEVHYSSNISLEKLVLAERAERGRDAGCRPRGHEAFGRVCFGWRLFCQSERGVPEPEF